MLIFLFIRLHRPQRLHNIELGGRAPGLLGAGGIRELTLQANEIEQMLKYRKASFPKSVSTAFVAHCSLGTIKLMLCSTRSYCMKKVVLKKSAHIPIVKGNETF